MDNYNYENSMNWLERIFFKDNPAPRYSEEHVQKLLTGQQKQFENQLNRFLYQLRGKDAPSWNADDQEKYYTAGYATNADLFAVIQTILVECGAFDWVLEEKNGNRWDRIEDHQIIDTWNNPNPHMTNTEFVQSCIGYSLLGGNNYIYMPKLSGGLDQGQAHELYVMPSALTTIVFSGNPQKPYGGFSIQYAPGIIDKIDASEVIHIKDWNPLPDEQRDLYGMSPLRSMAMTIRRSNSSELTQTKSIENYGPPGAMGPDYSGIDTEDIEPFTDLQLEEQKQRYKKALRPENKGIPLFMALPWKYQMFGMSPGDLKILESMEIDLKKLCNGYRVPFRLLNDGMGGSYNNMEQDMKRLYTGCLLPRLYRLGEKVTKGWIHPGWGESFRLRPDASNIEVLQKNMKDTVAYLGNAWWIKGSRKQEIMGEEPDPEMDVYFVPNNLTPFTSLEDAFTQQQQDAILTGQEQQQPKEEEID